MTSVVRLTKRQLLNRYEQPIRSLVPYYISAADLELRLNANQPTSIIDIQIEEEFFHHHIQGAIPTYAYPVKSAEDQIGID